MTAEFYLHPSLLEDFDLKVGQAMRAARLKQSRGRRTLARTAERLQCTLQQLHKYETGRDALPLHRMMMFCVETKMTPGALLGCLGVPRDVPAPKSLLAEQVMLDNIRAAFIARRDTLRLSQSVVAEGTGVCLRQYRHYETGSHRMRPQTYFRIAAVLRMTPSQATLLAVTAAQPEMRP